MIRTKYFLLSSVIALTIFFYVLNSLNKSRIATNHAVACASLTAFNTTKGGGSILYYEFVVNGNKVVSNSGCTKLTKQKYFNGLKHLPVVYEVGREKNQELLEEYDDFEKYNISYQDTIGIFCK